MGSSTPLFDPSIQEAEAGTSLSWKLSWCAQQVPGLHSEILSQII